MTVRTKRGTAESAEYVIGQLRPLSLSCNATKGEGPGTIQSAHARNFSRFPT